MAPTIEIRIGESGPSFASRNANILKIDHQPAGLNFYQIRFPGGSRGRVTIMYGDSKLAIDNVINVMGTEDLDFTEEGLLQFEINSALSGSDLISHDEARSKFFSILQNIVRLGWETTIPLSMARLRGKEMTQYFLTSKRRTTLDPSYVPTLDEWMQMRSLTSWKFYSAHSYLTVSFTREHTLTDPSKLGAYLLSFEIRGEAEQFRRNVDGLDRARWKEVLPDALRKLAATRAKMEAELRAKGATIDSSYIDPPVPDNLRK